jgi:teichuronic acid exporter
LDRKAVTSGFAWTFSVNIILKLVLFVTSLVVARIIGPTEMGIFALLATIVGIADLLRDAGLGETFIADKEAGKEQERVYWSLAILFGVVLSASLVASRYFIEDFFGSEVLSQGLVVVSLAVLANGVNAIPMNKLLKMGRFREVSLADAVATFAASVVALILVLMGYGFWGLVWQLVLRSVLYLLICWRLAPLERFSFSLKGASRTLHRAHGLLVANSMHMAFMMSDQLFIMRLLGETAVGHYSVAKTFAQRPVELLSAPLRRTLFTAYSAHAGDDARLGSVFGRTIAATILVVMPIFAFMAALAHPMILALLGEQYRESAQLVAILSLYMGARSIGTLAGSLLVAVGQPKKNVYCWIVGLTVTAGIILYLGDRVTLGDVAWAYALGAVVVYVMMTVIAVHEYMPSAQNMHGLERALFVTSFSALAYVFLSKIPLQPWPLFLLAATMAPIVHLAMAGLVYERNPIAFVSLPGVKRLWRSL